MADPSQTIRVIIQQPALPKYRVPVFRELARRPGIDLELRYGNAPGSPANASPAGFRGVFSPIRRVGYLLWHAAAWTAASRSKCDVLVMTWDLHYLHLIPTLLRARLSGVSTILWGHGYSKKERQWRGWARRLVSKLANAVLFYNHGAENLHLVKYNFKRDRTFVALNAIDQSPILAAQQEWLGDERRLSAFREENGLVGRDVVLFVSRLMRENRLDLLLEALVQLVPARPNIQVVIIGGGEDLPRLQALAHELNIADHVRFVGAVYEEPSLAPWFICAKVFCYPANIGLSILHAFGYGLPVVTSDQISAQNPEIEAMVHEYNGLYYRDGDSTSLSRMILRLLADDPLRNRLAVNARSTVERRFSLPNMIRGLEAAVRYCSGEPVSSNAEPAIILPEQAGECRLRLAVISNAHTPYRLHVHRRVVREMPEVQLYSLYTHEASNAPWAFSPPAEIRPILFGRGENAEGQSSLRRAYHEWRKGGRIIHWLKRHRIRAIILLGYNDLGRLRILRWCKRNGVRVMLWGDSNSRGDNAEGLRRAFKQMLVPAVIRRCDAVLVCGERGREYFRNYGATEEKMFYWPVEPDFAQIRELPAERIEQTRHKYQLAKGRRRIVFSGRLVPVKRCDLLIDAFVAIAADRPEWDLVIVGDGPLRTELGTRVPMELRERVFWTGFFPHQLDVFSIYRLCDVLVLPSDYEPWALVLLEAVAAGLAIVCSDVVGAAPEVVNEGHNGFTFKPGGLRQLVTLLLRVTDPRHIDQYRAASKEVLNTWQEKADLVRGLGKAIQYVKPQDT